MSDMNMTAAELRAAYCDALTVVDSMRQEVEMLRSSLAAVTREISEARLAVELREALIAKLRQPSPEHQKWRDLMDHTPTGTRPMPVYLLGLQVIVCGSPDPDDEGHNCDAMGCTSVSHVVWRGYAADFFHALRSELAENHRDLATDRAEKAEAALAASIAREGEQGQTMIALKCELVHVKGVLEDFAEQDCFYADGCPTFGSNHGKCTGCRARAALEQYEVDDGVQE